MPVAPGTRLGPYEVAASLGAGGMGEVFRARDTRLERPVAIKVLPPNLAEDAEALARFTQEARAVAALNHPNILGIFDVGTAEGVSYVVMELLEGHTFRQLLDQGPLPPRQAAELGIQIAQGLAAAHDQGIVHRDLKPENLFLTRDGRVKILDFGLAKRTVPVDPGQREATAPLLTSPGIILGTLGYMSPEQVRGGDLDARSDFFAFGVVLFELLTGKRPFHRDTTADTLSAILKEDIPELSLSGHQLHPALERIVRHCLEKAPQRRFQNARDLAFALESCLGGASAALRQDQIPTGRLPVPAAPRHPWARVAAGLCLTALLPAAFVLGRRGARAPAPALTQLASGGGEITGGRFTRDGRSVIFSAAWVPGEPAELYVARVDGTEVHPMDIQGLVQSVSDQGEILLLRPDPAGDMSTLAKVPLAGGTPKEVATGVLSADWIPGEADLALIRGQGGMFQVEFPAGKVVHSSPSQAFQVRVSPEGRRVAFSHFDSSNTFAITVVDRAGRVRTWARTASPALHLAWAPDGNRLLFTARDARGIPALFATDRAGKPQALHASSYLETVLDADADGQVLSVNQVRTEEAYLDLGGEPQPLAVAEYASRPKLGADGRVVALTAGMGEGHPAVYFQREAEAQPARLGPGTLRDLCPNGAWALVRMPTTEFTFQLQPLGPGQAIALPEVFGADKPTWLRVGPSGAMVLGLTETAWIKWEDAGRRVLPLPVKGTLWPYAISPDEAWALATQPAGPGRTEWVVVSLGDGALRPVPGGPRPATLVPLRWAKADLLYAWRPKGPGLPAELVKVDPWTGVTTPLRTLAFPTRGFQFGALDTSLDGRVVAYSGTRIFRSRLNLLAGLLP